MGVGGNTILLTSSHSPTPMSLGENGSEKMTIPQRHPGGTTRTLGQIAQEERDRTIWNQEPLTAPSPSGLSTSSCTHDAQLRGYTVIRLIASLYCILTIIKSIIQINEEICNLVKKSGGLYNCTTGRWLTIFQPQIMGKYVTKFKRNTRMWKLRKIESASVSNINKIFDQHVEKVVG